MIFEIFDQQKNDYVLFIGETMRVYRQKDGSAIMNDERVGFSYFPDEPYDVLVRRLTENQLSRHPNMDR